MIWASVLIVSLSLGIISGMLPGIGMTVVIVSLLPVFRFLSIEQTLFAYVILVSTMQYYGSVSSILFGAMGELTSLPAVANGHTLYKRGLGVETLMATATSSFIASLFGIAAVAVISMNFSMLMPLLSGSVRTVILLSMLLIMIGSSNAKILSAIMAVIGLMIGYIGLDVIESLNDILPAYSIIDGGIPTTSVMVGVIVIPLILHYARMDNHPNNTMMATPKSKFSMLTKLSLVTWLSTLRGTVVGILCGLIPGVSYVISSNIAELVEKFLNKSSDDNKSLMNNVVSAESANNSGAIVVLAPLILFAIPIVPTESIILSLIEAKGFSYNMGIEFIQNHWVSVILIMISINAINWLISGYLYVPVSYIMKCNMRVVYVTVLLISIASVLIDGYSSNQFSICLITLCVATVVGMLIKNASARMLLILSMIISPTLLPELYRQYLVFVY